MSKELSRCLGKEGEQRMAEMSVKVGNRLHNGGRQNGRIHLELGRCVGRVWDVTSTTPFALRTLRKPN